MERNTAEVVVKVFAVLFWVFAILSVLGALFLFGIGALGSMGGAMGMTPEERAAGGLLAGLGVVFGVIALIVAVLDVIVGWGLWVRRPWARTLALVLFVISLISFPLGTIFGAVGIWLFGFEESVKSIFSTPARAAKAASAKKKK